MKKLFTFLLATLIAQTSFSQITDFENLTFPAGKNYWKGNVGVSGNTTFQSGFVTLRNQNDTSSWGDYWSGWAYSRIKDTISIAYDTSDCSAFVPIDTSLNNYVVAYLSYDELNNHIIFNKPTFSFFAGFKISNSTITYRSLQNGDGIAKKFGGITGNDPDYFKVRFTGWINGNPLNDTVDFYLADFRDSNNANDYIIKDWTYVNCSQLGFADSLTYTLESSDMGSFGMNTPAYFCLDKFNFTVTPFVNNITQNLNVKIYPNPFNNEFQISNTSRDAMKFAIMNLNGQIVFEDKLNGNNSLNINSSNWSKGIYIVKIQQGQNQFYQKIIK